MTFGRDRLALTAGVIGPLLATAIMTPWREDFENTDAALILVVVVVAVASAGSRAAGYVAALSSAVWFDFFLTRPYGQFSIDRASDVETTVLLLVIGAAVTEIAVWGRRQQASASERAGYLNGIHAAAEAAVAADGGFGAVGHVSTAHQVFTLSSCQFQQGVAGLGVIGRLHHDGASRWVHGHGRATSVGCPPAETWSCWCRAVATCRGVLF